MPALGRRVKLAVTLLETMYEAELQEEYHLRKEVPSHVPSKVQSGHEPIATADMAVARAIYVRHIAGHRIRDVNYTGKYNGIVMALRPT